MGIRFFAYRDSLSDWTLERVTFNQVNLLVGLSGVGKTWILSALKQARDAAVEGGSEVPGLEWFMEIDGIDSTYKWEVKTGRSLPLSTHAKNLDSPGKGGATFEFERLSTCDGEVIFDRRGDEFSLGNSKLPRIKDTESAVSLLRREAKVKPIFDALSRMLRSDVSENYYAISPAGRRRVEELAQKCSSIDDLRSDWAVPIPVRAYVLQLKFPDIFRRVVEQYEEIFPQVTEVRFDFLSKLGSSLFSEFPEAFHDQSITCSIREAGIANPVAGFRLSAGMHRTLTHLFEIVLAPPGSIILIDEVENSLGANCLPGLFERFLEVSSDLQFIVTSHHPYVINNVPINQWKLVTRHGSTVTVRSGKDIKALQTASNLDTFNLLINAPEYEEGIA